jgi:hypothetical protein
MTVYGRSPAEAGVESQAAGVVVVAVGDRDAGEVLEWYLHPFGVAQENVRGAGVHQPAVAVWQLDENREAVLRFATVGSGRVVAENREDILHDPFRGPGISSPAVRSRRASG